MEKLGQIFRRRIHRVKRRLIVQKFVVEPLDHFAQHPLQVREIVEQPDRIQLRPFQRHPHPVIVPVRIFALALVPAQRVPGRKCLFHADFKHAHPAGDPCRPASAPFWDWEKSRHRTFA